MNKWETGEKQNCEELHNLYSTPNVIKINELRRRKWMDYVAGMKEGSKESFRRKARRKQTKGTFMLKLLPKVTQYPLNNLLYELV
jgi:hypothetical protein